MRRVVFFAMIVIGGLVSSVCLGYSGGAGTTEAPYQIADANDLLELGVDTDNYNKCFILTADIDLSLYDGQEGRAVFHKIGYYSTPSNFHAFTGTFDGNYHTITNFRYTKITENMVGLFGYIDGDTSEVRNLTLENPYVSLAYPRQQIGCLAGLLKAGSIKNCHVNNGTTVGDFITGGLVGRSNQGTIMDSSFEGEVFGEGDVGGLVGSNDGGTIHACTVHADVSSMPDTYGTGGLIGSNNYGTITNCSVFGTVTGDCFVGGLIGSNPMELGGEGRHGHIYFCSADVYVNGNEIVGGLLGGNFGQVRESFALGVVEGNEDVGGLIGCNSNFVSDSYAGCLVIGGSTAGGLIGLNYGYVYKSYSTGQVTGTAPIGGLLGSNWGGIAEDVFWDIQTSGLTTMCGQQVCGGTGCNNSAGKSTSSMKSYLTYYNAGWDFTNEILNGTNDYWRMCADRVDYPHLTWEYVRHGDFACPDGVNAEDLGVLSGCWLETVQARSDINDDGKVDFEDIARLSQNWLMTDCGTCNDADITGDGNVDDSDLTIMIEQWLLLENPCCQMTDLNADGRIDLADFSMFAQQWMDGL